MQPAAVHNTDEFISGGYYLVKPARRLEGLSALLPDPFLTLSPCLTDVGPRHSWSHEWGTFTLLELQDEGLDPESVDSILKRMPLPDGISLSDEIVPFGFSSFALARAFYAHFAPPMVLLGIGLHVSLKPAIRPQRMKGGWGVRERIAQRLPLAPGTILGFEPLGCEGMSFHSWICNAFPDNVSRDFNIQPAPNGFIASFTDAVRVNDYILSHDPEPAIWLPWLVVRYDRPPVAATSSARS